MAFEFMKVTSLRVVPIKEMLLKLHFSKVQSSNLELFKLKLLKSIPLKVQLTNSLPIKMVSSLKVSKLKFKSSK